ncbi:uncharacterized protein LOC144099505 isoform X2 [Amblyomma americanum]
MTSLKFVRTILYLCTGVNAIQVFKYVTGGYRVLHSSGWIFDVLYGIETGLNLVSDVIILQALQLSKQKETKMKLMTFLGWNCISTSFCYVTSLFLAGFLSEHLPLQKEHLKDLQEKEFRGAILYAMYQFYQNWDKEQQGDGVIDASAYAFQAGGPPGAPGQPYYITAPQPAPGTQQPVPGGPQMFAFAPQPLAPGAQQQFPGGPSNVVYLYGGMPAQPGPFYSVQPRAPVASQQPSWPHVEARQGAAQEQRRD